MTSAKILIAEDESITAKDIAETLKSQGYDVPAIALSGEEAIQKTEEIRPDLVLMDIVLKGNVDGIAAARQIHDRFGIPVVYLTAYADSEIVKRARLTEPFGYIIKPFEARELRSNIEMALYKHKAEDAVRRSKKQWENTFNAISDWVVLTDIEGRILRTNRAGENFTGKPLAEIVGQSCCKLVHGLDKHITGCPLMKMLQTGQRASVELHFPSTDRWLMVTVDHVRDEKGNLVGAVHITCDITDRKKAEKRIRNSEEKYRDIFENAREAIVTIDLKGKITNANKIFEEYGFKREELLGKSIFDFIAKDYLAQAVSDFETSIAGNPVRGEMDVITPKGRVTVEYTDNPIIRVGEITGFQAILTDITERKRAEEALQENEEKYRDIFENAREAIVTIDLKGRISNANKIVEEYGLKREELPGKSIFDFIAKDYRAQAVRDFKSLVGGNSVKGEMDVITPKGNITVEYRDNPIRRRGQIVGVQIMLTDITERKRAEEQIAKLAKFPAEDPNPVLRISKDCTILYANRASSVALETWGKKVGERLPQDCCNRVEEALSSGKVSTFEFACHDGRIFEVTLAPVVESGYVNVYGLDITEQKQAMEQIEKLARFPAEDPNPVLRVSGYGTVVYGNKSSEPLLKLWRCRVGGSLSGRWYDLVLDALSCGQNQQIEVQSGEQTFSLVLTPVMESNYVNIYGLDITERKRAEDKVQEGRDYLEGLTNSMWDMVFSVKIPERVIEWVNNSIRLLGYEPQECVGKTTEFLYPNRNEYLDLGKKLTEAIEAGEDVLHTEQFLRRKNGEIFPAEITTTLFKEKGEITRVTSIVRDITEHKKSEQKVLEHQNKLRSMASELSLAEERERRHIAEGLHDDIIQPLAFLDIKLDSLKNPAREQDLTESCNQMQETIRELIRMTRAFTFDLSSPVLYELGLEAAVEEWLATNIREKYEIETVFEDDDRSKPLDDDMRALLFKAVKELLINVVKHAEASSVKVSIARDNSKINIRVEDNGTGFHPDREKDRFFHFSGYGLFSIRERLKQLGGNIEIESASGQGTRVTLAAPLKPES